MLAQNSRNRRRRGLDRGARRPRIVASPTGRERERCERHDNGAAKLHLFAQRLPHRLLERDAAGNELVGGLKVVYASLVVAPQRSGQRHEIDLARRVGYQRNLEVLLRQRSQGVAVKHGGVVGELRPAVECGDRGRGLAANRTEIVARRREVGFGAPHVLLLFEPEEDRQVETERPSVILQRIEGGARAGNQIVVEGVADRVVRRVFQTRELERGLAAARGERRLENLLALRVRAAHQRVERDVQALEAQPLVERERLAGRAVEQLVEHRAVIVLCDSKLALLLTRRRQVELGRDKVSLGGLVGGIRYLRHLEHLLEVTDILRVHGGECRV